jgi:hypothetical protein
MAGYIKRWNKEAKELINLAAEVEIQKEHLRAEFAKGITGSNRYAQIKQGLRELDAEL